MAEESVQSEREVEKAGVFVAIEGKGGKKFMLRIGTAWFNKDNIRLVLNANPLNGELRILNVKGQFVKSEQEE